jgi:hypothetical protein
MMSYIDNPAGDAHWQRLVEDKLRRQEELESLALELAAGLGQRLDRLDAWEADYVRECLRDYGY